MHLREVIVRAARAAVVMLPLALAGCLVDGGSSSSSGTLMGGSATSSASLPVTIKNKSGHTVYVLITGDTVSVSPATTATIANDASATFDVTQLSAGRIYLSYHQALSSNAPDGANTHDPDYLTRFDKVELTYGPTVPPQRGGNANLTAVDFYAIPLMLETSIGGTVIQRLTLAAGQSGTSLTTALANLIGAANPGNAVVTSASGETLRVLSPVKRPAAYGSFDAFLSSLTAPTSPATTFTIAGTYFGSTSQSYSYTGTMDGTGITLTNATQTHTIVVSHKSLKYSATDLTDENGIYTCDAPFTVDGTAHEVSDNDIYAAVYRDLVTGFNLGFVSNGANDSSAWWLRTAFPQGLFSGTYFNNYAQVMASYYPGAYGFPFSDRYRQVLADLGGKVDALTITVLADDAVVPAYVPQGNINPQSGPAGSPTFNLSLQTTDSNFNLTTFTFDTQTYQGGVNYDFPTTVSQYSTPNNTAVINSIPTQDGLNIYALEVRGRKYTVLAKVSSGAVEWAALAGGAGYTWQPYNTLYVGGLN